MAWFRGLPVRKTRPEAAARIAVRFILMKPSSRYVWAAWGDVNAFFGLMIDNVAVMILLAATVSTPLAPARQQPGGYRFTQEFVLTRMIPGTALGVLLGDLVYTWMAVRLARRTGRPDVTAMPLGLDTPSTFGVALLVLLPALNEARARGLDHEAAMNFAWRVGAVTLVLIGVFKVLCAPVGNAVRRWVPRAGLLGSLAAVALTMIAFLPLLMEVAAVPLVGLLVLTVILVTLVAHRPLPGKIPGVLAAVVLGVVVYHLLDWLGGAQGWTLVPPRDEVRPIPWHVPDLLPDLDWGNVLQAALARLPLALPFALATIVGGIDCTESAAAAGDEYDTRAILLTEGAASVAAALLGGVIQTTPYIGHPAYKAMGGRAAYTLATALFVGAVGFFGWFPHLFEWLPRAALYPILIFVGLEITAQSFRATPAHHYPALALAALPALAYLATIPLGRVLTPDAPAFWQPVFITLRCLANGFIVTSLLWAASLAALLDGRSRAAAGYLLAAAVFAFFGVIHSPLADSPLGLPTQVIERLERLPAEAQAAALLQTPYHWTAAYVAAALLFLLLSFRREPGASKAEPETASGKSEFR